MKLTILQENLKKGLGIVSQASIKSLSFPILNNILLQTEKTFLRLSGTDLETGINWWTLAKVNKEGKIIIPTQVFSNFIGLLPNKKINLEIKDLLLEISCENYKTQLKGFDPEEFPIIPQVPREEKVSVESKVFCKGLNQVVSITSPSTTRPEISGIYLTFTKDSIKMVATDSFRLGEKIISLGKSSEIRQQYSLILPQKAAREIINIFEEDEGELHIYLAPNQILFEKPMAETEHPQIQLVSRLIEGEYPNYQEIIPKKYETQIILQRNEFLNQIKTASLFSGKINEVKLKVDPKTGKVEIFSQSPDLGDYQSFFSGQIKGQLVEISFNHRFLADGLANIKSSEVIFELSGEGGPGVLKPVGDQSYLYIVMPIKAS